MENPNDPLYVPETVTCRRCGTIDAPVIGPGAGPHVARALCKGCGSFVQWLSRFSPAEQAERRRTWLAKGEPS